MKRTLLLVFLATSCAAAQENANVVYRTSGSIVTTAPGTAPSAIQGAPYSATVTNETVQTLADGNRITQTSTGTTARDSQGRTRQDMALPAIGNLSAANAPRIVFVYDAVAQTSFTLNFSDKTAQKMAAPPPLPDAAGAPGTVSMRVVTSGGGVVPPPDIAISGPMPVTAGGMFIQRQVIGDGQKNVAAEDLGSETMEGVLVNGTRTTLTIPAGEVGNERPIAIVTEVWTSPDLKTVVYSKRTDPRVGETTFRLSNLVRAEPDPSLFTIPPDFKIVDAPRPILYRSKP